ncbi:hypothetical protein JQ604_30905 [Bradyrhizobium jicamae]|uniref:hypothetical protein n=1 Tax=Bradyrhizobium jicamae TaxID=280332 RepID=UPI001BA51834|nr:hypothetical protein [Bradyrhizobium jicamae]MBR0756609.1 hypothetical protein [Bradyrhizobium jicamae]
MADESDLTGAAFDLASAGYKSMPDPKQREEGDAIGGDSGSLREAASRIATPEDEVAVRRYRDAEGRPAASNEAVTLERASRDYAAAVAAEQFITESEDAQDLAARVDDLRAEALANNPDAAEFYGFELPETKVDRSGSARGESDPQTGEQNSPGFGDELDPELARALQHPQVRRAIEEEIAAIHEVRQDYADALSAASQVAQASFISQFPELAAVPPESLPGVLEQMSRQEPDKFARVQAAVAATEQLSARQRQEDARRTEIAHQNFLAFAKAEDTRFDGMLKGESPETQHAVMQEIISSAKASGVEPAELRRLFNSEPLMRNAIFQRMMYDAGKYRLMMKAKDAATSRPIPPVQRPGAASSRAERASADMKALNARLSSSGNIKDAVALYNARRSSRS